MEMDLEKMKARRKVFSSIVDLLCETKDKRMLFFRDTNKFYQKLSSISITNDITDEQFNNLSILIKQFNELIDDFIKTEKIEIKEN